MSKRRAKKERQEGGFETHQVRQRLVPLEVGDVTLHLLFPVERVPAHEDDRIHPLSISITGDTDGELVFSWPEVSPPVEDDGEASA